MTAAACDMAGELHIIDAAGELQDGAQLADSLLCPQEESETNSELCSSAVNLGDLRDSNETVEAIGNIVPEGDVDFYGFQAIDSLDGSCDDFHVRVWFLENPGDAFVFDAWRGGCDAEQLCDGVTDFQWYTNFSEGGIGECPCSPTATNNCGDDTAFFHVRVRRKDGLPVTCDDYRLELSNGKYPPPT